MCRCLPRCEGSGGMLTDPQLRRRGCYLGRKGLGALALGGGPDSFELALTFLLAAGLMAAGAVSIRTWPFVDTSSRPFSVPRAPSDDDEHLGLL